MTITYKILLDGEEKPITISESEPSSYPGTHLWGWSNREDCPIFAPESMIRPTEEFDRNLNNRRKVQFESELAFTGLMNNHLFRGTLKELGKAAEHWLASQDSSVPNFYDRAGRVFKRYYYTDKPYLGRKGSKQEAEDKQPAKIYHESIIRLSRGKDIPETLFGHMAVMRILSEVLEIRPQVGCQLRPTALFANRGRSHKRARDCYELSRVPGIEVDQPVVIGRVMPHSKTANRTQRKVLADEFSSFVYDAYLREIPFIGGPSGSAAECLMFALFFSQFLPKGCLSEEELKIYTFCCMTYLISAGAHSFHEVAVIANLAGVPYKVGLYEDPLPDCIKATKDYQELLRKYPDLIQPSHFPFVEGADAEMKDCDEPNQLKSDCLSRVSRKRKNMTADVCSDQDVSFASKTKKQKKDEDKIDQNHTVMRAPFVLAGSSSSSSGLFSRRLGIRSIVPSVDSSSGVMDLDQSNFSYKAAAKFSRKK